MFCCSGGGLQRQLGAKKGGAAAYEAFAAVCGGVSLLGKVDVVHPPRPVCSSRSLFVVAEGFFVSFMSIDLLRWSAGAEERSSGEFNPGMPWVVKPEVSGFFKLWWVRHFGSRSAFQLGNSLLGWVLVCCTCFPCADGG